MDITRYAALLRVCDMACAHAAATQADTRPEFFDVLSAALADDCPRQSAAAAETARRMRAADESREQFLASIQPTDPKLNLSADGDGQHGGNS